MNSVDFSRESSTCMSSRASTSRISTKAQKEANNAFLVSENGSGSSALSGKSDSRSYSLSDHFSGDTTQSETPPAQTQKSEVDFTDPDYLFGDSFNMSLFVGSMPNMVPVETDVTQVLQNATLRMQTNTQPVVAENSSTTSSQGRMVLPEGLQSVSSEKLQPIVQQLILNSSQQGGTLDAQKTTPMYRPFTSADLTASKKMFSESTVDVRGVLRTDTAQAVAASGQSEQRQSDTQSGKDETRDQQQKSQSHILNQADIQSRMDPASMVLAESQRSAATTTRLQNMEDLNPTIMEHMDRLQKSQQKQLKLKLELPDGEILSVQLKLDGGAVHVRFESGSEELLNSLAEGWGALEEAAQERGVVVSNPRFESTSSVEDALSSIADNSKQSAYSFV